MIRAIFSLILASVLVASCSKRDDANSERTPIEHAALINDQLTRIDERYPDAQSSESGLRYEVTASGSGEEKPTVGQNVMAHYSLTLFDGGDTIDSSFERGRPFVFAVGTGQVIKAWDEAILDMKKGEKRTLIVPSSLGYGERGAGGVIPPNAILVFDVELVDF